MEDTFTAFGIEPKTAANIAKNDKVSTRLLELIALSGHSSGSKVVGDLLYNMSTKFPDHCRPAEEFLVQKIVSGDITKKDQFNEAIKFIRDAPDMSNLDETAFNEACGVGVVVDEADVKATVDELFERNKDAILEEKWNFNFSNFIHHVRDTYKWADGKVVTTAINSKKDEMLGEMPKDWKKKNKKEKKEKKAAKPAKEEEKLEPGTTLYEKKDRLSKLLSREVAGQNNTPELLAKHNEITGGKVRTR